MVFVVWAAAGLLTLFGALVSAELSSIFTQSGGVYVYLKEAFSPSIGFLWGWAMFWSMHSGIIAALAVILARYVGYFIPLGDIGIKGTAISVIILLSVINYIGVKQGSTLQTLFTFGKIFVIAVLIIVGFILGGKLEDHFSTGTLENTSITVENFILALIAGLFAFGGWHMVAYNSEETVNPRRTIPRALIFGTLIVTVCYIALNAVYLYILPLDVVASSTRIAADVAEKLTGFGGGGMLSSIVIFSIFGSLSGIILAGPRVYYAMSQDGLLFKWIGSIHPVYRTPSRAIVLQAVWSSFLVATGTFRGLFTRVIYTEWLFFGLMAITLFIFRRRVDLKRDYHVWGYPVVPALFSFSCFAIVISLIFSDPVNSLIGLSFVAAGLPIYYIWVKSTSEGNKRHADH